MRRIALQRPRAFQARRCLLCARSGECTLAGVYSSVAVAPCGALEETLVILAALRPQAPAIGPGRSTDSGTLSEPPGADPHVRWCGRRRGERPGVYPLWEKVITHP